MKRLLLLVTVSMLLAMWLLSAWELAQASASATVLTIRVAPATPLPTPNRIANLDGNDRIVDIPFRPALPRADFQESRPEHDRLERPAAGTPIFCDSIEQQRLIR
jgi:hypothetical protein